MTRRHARAALASAALALACLSAPAVVRAADELPMQLPGDAGTARVEADAATWIVGAQPGATAARLARASGARRTGPAGTGGYVIGRSSARAFAAALRARGILLYAQPNVLRHTSAMPKDPVDVSRPWRDDIVAPTLTPPAVSAASPLIALVDAAADVNHPELVGHTTTIPGMPIVNPHGTATASTASAAANGVGFSGVWPGARTLNVPLDEDITCDDSANGIAAAIKAKASVINMSYGATERCVPEETAIQYAVAGGIVPVAAAGNEFTSGNPPEFPASLPHVVTVAATGRGDRPAYFSNRNSAVDVAAPGVSIPVAVPVALDADHDGYAVADGTSFAAPMVSAAIAWVRAARPDLRADQAADVLRYSARDVGDKGYDSSTGYGMISLAGALTRKPPPHDPAEPNDDIRWVDGRMFGKPDPVLYKGFGPGVRVAATLDRVEDPHDVWRVKVRGHGSVRLSANAVYGHIDLRVLSPAARKLSEKRRVVARSARPGERTERLTIHNRSRHPRSYFVSIDVSKAGERLDAGYVLKAWR